MCVQILLHLAEKLVGGHHISQLRKRNANEHRPSLCIFMAFYALADNMIKSVPEEQKSVSVQSDLMSLIVWAGVVSYQDKRKLMIEINDLRFC